MLSVRFLTGVAVGYVIGALGGREQLDSVIAKIRAGLGEETPRRQDEAREEPTETGGDHVAASPSSEKAGDQGPKHRAGVPAGGRSGGNTDGEDSVPTPAELAGELEATGTAAKGTSRSAEART